MGPWGNTNLKGTAPRRTAAVIAYGTRRCAVASDMGDGGTAAAGLGPQLCAAFFWKAYLSIEQPLTAHGPIHLRCQAGTTALRGGPHTAEGDSERKVEQSKWLIGD